MLHAEVAAYVEAHTDEVDENGRRLVVRNGHHNAGEVTTAAGAVAVRAPRANDKRFDSSRERQRLSSAILPARAWKSPRVAEVLPLLYLPGLSTSDFGPALSQFLGSDAGLSAATINRLTTQWHDEAQAFSTRSLAETLQWRRVGGPSHCGSVPRCPATHPVQSSASPGRCGRWAW